MNKPLWMIALALLSLDANASWYGGVNLGINAAQVKKNLLYPLNNTSPIAADYRSGYTGFHGQLFAGYDLLFHNQFTAAVEANADLFTGRSHYTINNWSVLANVDAKEKLENGFSLFLLPGYQYNPYVRFFAGPGITTSRFAIQSDPTAGNVGVAGDFRKWLLGGGFKAGVATNLTDNLNLVFTYQYTQYQNASWANIEPVTDETLRGYYRPNVHIIMVGLKYNFSGIKGYTK